MNTWYEITVLIKGEVVIFKTTYSLEDAENTVEDLKHKRIEAKILLWKLENNKNVLVGEL